MKQIELLAPAKNLESGISAIKCGADAVYIAAERFGARSAAGNSMEDIEQLIKFAHKYRAKIYITINTLFKDKEIPYAYNLIQKLYQIDADAIIVQDMGLLELDLPPIPLFASTQANNTTPEKVKFLEKVGFQRVILARELSLEKIKEIKAKTKVDLEFFVHGALCVCYSGQCYMSYAIGGRSGNRGECAQPCRKKYTLADSENKIISEDKYLLSLKDLNLSNHLENLINAGISSFKIEGRLKDISYIKNIVSYYRQKLDIILDNNGLEKSSGGKSLISFSPNPNKTFNRGYSEYFLNGTASKIASIKTPKSIGEEIGKVNFVQNNSFSVSGNVKLNNADGICFFDKDTELQGTIINKVMGNNIFPDEMKGIQENTFIYRNLDHEFLKILKNSKIERKIGVNLYLSQENDSLIFVAIDEDGIKAQINLKNSFELAQNKEKALETLEKQFLKLGETDFYANSVEINLKEAYFIPVKEINETRRQLIQKLEEEKLKSYTPQIIKIEKNNFPYPDKKLDYTGNVLNKYAEEFYKRHGVEEIEPAAESGINMRGKNVMKTKYCLKHQLNLCPKQTKTKEFTEPFYIYEENNQKYELKFDCANCEMQIEIFI
ncbi:MAG: hypothetical protein A2039_06200 [Candidatus Melainabacteria bacterium GWA2_34_9]|nr:MAG: hypothetical protein A2039_06200 [Candidatus Melainabacteria bacterium GWA2_34_9]